MQCFVLDKVVDLCFKSLLCDKVSRLECAALLASRTPDEYRVCVCVNYWAYSTVQNAVIKIASNTFFLAWQYKVEFLSFLSS